MGAVLLGIIEPDDFLEMLLGEGEVPHPEHSPSQSIVGLEKLARILSSLGQAQELLGKLVCSPGIPPDLVELPKASQGVEELRRLADLPADLKRPAKHLLHVLGRIAASGHEWRPQGELEGELVLKPLRPLGNLRQQRYALGEVADRFLVGRAPDGALAGALPVRNSLGTEPGLRVVMGYQLGLRLGGRRTLRR